MKIGDLKAMLAERSAQDQKGDIPGSVGFDATRSVTLVPGAVKVELDAATAEITALKGANES